MSLTSLTVLVGICTFAALSSALPQSERTISSSCVTEGGDDTGSSCVFPFIYKNQVYNGCTLAGADDGERWCSTKLDSQGVHVSGEGKWGHCGQGCPQDQEISLLSCQDDGGIEHPDGSSWTHTDGCNSCRCLAGEASCTERFCGDIPIAGSRLGSSVPQKNCICSDHTETDHRGQQIGKCQTKFSGKNWCYIQSNSNCADKKKSKRGHNLFWSHEACQRKPITPPSSVKKVLWIPEGSSSLTLSLPNLSRETSNCVITNPGVDGYKSQFQMIQGKLYACNHLECKSYNDEAKRWDIQAGMKFQIERRLAASTVIGDKWIVQGGAVYVNGKLINVPTTEEWTPGQPNWKVSTNNKYISTFPVAFHCLLTLQSDGNDKVMQIGGYSQAGGGSTNRCFIDGREVASMKRWRHSAGCSVLQGKVYVGGGIVAGGEYNSVEIYDPQRDQWTDGPTLPFTGDDYYPQLVEIKNELHYIGGRSSGKIWRLGNNRWEEVAQVEKSDKFAAAVVDKHCE